MPISETVSENRSASGGKEFIGKKIPVLDHGFIVLVDIMGDDSAIVQGARVSYGKGTKTVSKDRELIRYLMRHRHTSPFEMVEFKFHVKLPIFVARQWIRHRTASVNEYSARYSILEDEFYIPEPEVMAEQSTTNRQGRENILPPDEAEKIRSLIQENGKKAYALYEYLLQEELSENNRTIKPAIKTHGLARELARIVIPTNVYTQWYWKIDLHNLLHFLSLRLDSSAQYEIRVYAQIMAQITKAAVPMAYEAFEDYQLNALHLSRQEIEVVRTFISAKGITEKEIESTCSAAGITNKLERLECTQKFIRLFGSQQEKSNDAAQNDT
jgi:thymidylate synthase (FAD)